MNILQVTPYFAPAWAYGGPPRVVLELSKTLVELGNSVTVYTTDSLGPNARSEVRREEIDGVIVERFRNVSNTLAWRNQVFFSPPLMRSISRNAALFDVVHAHTYRTIANVGVLSSSRRGRVPYVLTPHGTTSRASGRGAAKLLFDLLFGGHILADAAAVTAVSEWESRELLALDVDPGKISIIPNGLDPTPFLHLPDHGVFKARFGIVGSRLITYVGRLHRRKGIQYLIRAFGNLKEAIPDGQLIIIGPDDGDKARLRTICRECDVEDRTHFMGFLPDDLKLSAYVDSDVVVYPSTNEVFGIVPLESILCLTPVVVSRDVGISALIERLNVGRVVPYSDVRALTDAILEVAAKRHDLLPYLVEGRQSIIRDLDWKDIAEKTLRVYEKALSISA